LAPPLRARTTTLSADRKNDATRALRKYLDRCSVGSVATSKEISRLLGEAWKDLDGSVAESTSHDKLWRAENFQWNSPILTFDLERHGQTVKGSRLASVHSWTVDLDNRTASHAQGKARQVRPSAPPLDTQSIGAELAQLIQHGRKDERLVWKEPSCVRVLINEIISDDGPKQSVAGQRRRLREALSTILSPDGWNISSKWLVFKQKT
jgi:hypothetical protein